MIRRLNARETRLLNRDFRHWGREGKQLPPDGEEWRSWLILGGRGAGKTRAGAEWVRARALGLWPATGARSERIAIVAPTLGEARAVMIEGKSGLMAIHNDDERPRYEPSKRLLTWPNGSIAQVFSADEPESLRGPQFDAAWCDELHVMGRLDCNVQRGREVLSLLEGRGLDGLSIGFKTVLASRDKASATRKLHQVDLWEISLVTFPMLEGARVSEVKRRAFDAAARMFSAPAMPPRPVEPPAPSLAALFRDGARFLQQGVK